jgi:hypothetical protein
MAGYYLYSLDNDAFTQLTTSPTRQQAAALADAALEELEDLIEENIDEGETSKWPKARGALADAIKARLASSDWYSDLSYGDAQIWDFIIGNLDDKAGKKIGIRFKCENDGYLYWDAAQIAAEHGATMMAEPQFGSSGFRYFGKPSSKYSVYPMYSIYTPEQTKALLSQLEAVAPHFRSLPEGEGSDRDQFFKGLLTPVQKVLKKNRVLWVQTDT